jgi:Dna[CI] antecedent DciA-like protein
MTARERVLAQWRGVDLTGIEKARALRGSPVSSVIPGVLKELRLDRRQSEAEVAKVWNHLLDPNIVAHAQPIGLHKGTLFVAVDSSVWLSEIVRYRRKEILDRLQHSFGRDLISRISFRIG